MSQTLLHGLYLPLLKLASILLLPYPIPSFAPAYRDDPHSPFTLPSPPPSSKGWDFTHCKVKLRKILYKQ